MPFPTDSRDCRSDFLLLREHRKSDSFADTPSIARLPEFCQSTSTRMQEKSSTARSANTSRVSLLGVLLAANPHYGNRFCRLSPSRHLFVESFSSLDRKQNALRHHTGGRPLANNSASRTNC